MGTKKRLASLLCALAVASTMGTGVYADGASDTQSFKIVDAPSGAVYSVYRDVSRNYTYDDYEDVLVATFTCDGDGTGYVSDLEAGDYVAVLDTDYDDSRVYYNREYAFTYDGSECEVQEAFSSTEPVGFSTVSSTDSTVDIQYDVPLYKQSGPDASLWSSMRLNGSSDTMGYVGCLVCAFAMARSYEVGYRVYPNEMAATYSTTTGVGVTYAARGNSSMYVPASASNYGWTVYGSTGGYGGNGEIALNTKGNQSLYRVLYEKLQYGPVVFGGYSTPSKRGGSNHWIVVTGYHGDGQNFSAEDFTICDSSYNNGTNRTTLAQYSESYPYWDRLVYNENPTQYQLGDVDLDGSVTPLDLIHLKRYLLDLGDLVGVSVSNGDFNGNGYVDYQDVIAFKRLLLE